MAKREKKKENKRRLLLLIVLLVLTGVMLGTASYAWFTSNKKVSVENLNVDVRAVNGLEISADAVNWGVKIDKDNLISNEWVDQNNQLPDTLGNVSTVTDVVEDDNGNNYIQFFDGSVATECPNGEPDCENATYTLTAFKKGEKRCYDTNSAGDANNTSIDKCGTTGKHLMAFDIFLKVDKDNTKLYLTENATVENTGATDLGIKNTTRVAFLNRGFVDYTTYRDGDADTGEDGTTIAQSLNEAGVVKLWEPNAYSHTSAGVAAARTFYGITNLTAGDSNSAVAYEGVKAEITSPIDLTKTNSTQYPAYFQAVTPDYKTEATGHNRIDTGIVLNSGVTKIRVYFWVEGQDVDTENRATGSNMRLKLEFSID